MSLVPYKVTAIKKTDPTGNNVLPFATVSIIVSGGGFAQIWDDEAGTIVRGNPFQVDANGERQVWINGGEYSVSVSGGQAWDIKLTGGSDILQIENVAALSSFTPIVGKTYYLKEYLAGTGKGGGELIAKAGVITPNNVTTFASATAGVYFERINTVLNAYHAGAYGTGLVDDKTPIQRMIDLNIPIKPGKGVFLIGSALSGFVRRGFTIIGEGSYNTKLKFGYSGVAFDINTGASGFTQDISVSGITIEGNANTSIILRLRKIARSQFSDVILREANSASGIGLVLEACMLSRFERVMCSDDLETMTYCPSEGINIIATMADGNSSNNTFVSCYFEGGLSSPTMQIGARISGGTQNCFIGGSMESCTVSGLLISATSNNNTFVGVGFENLGAPGGDFQDGGNSTKFINCYASEKAILQGTRGEISGGSYERIQIDSGATKNSVSQVSVNGWSTGAGGFFDNGTGTRWASIYDMDLGQYIYPYKDRAGESLPASGSPFTNTSGDFKQIVAVGTGITGATITRNGITWGVPFTNTNISCMLAPNDQLTLTYTVAPTTFISVPVNGMQS